MVAVRAFPAGAMTISPDESAGQDTCVHAFAIPGPGASVDTSFDTTRIPDTSIAPFGHFPGATETVPFRNDPTDPNAPLREDTPRSLIAFDPGAVGFGADALAKAVARFAGVESPGAFDDPGIAAPVAVNLRPVLADRTETTVTWNNRPARGHSFWA